MSGIPGRPSFGGFSKRLKKIEKNLDQLAPMEPRNDSFYVVARECYSEFKSSLEAWRKGRRSDKYGEKYQISVRNRHWLNAGRHVDRLRALKE